MNSWITPTLRLHDAYVMPTLCLYDLNAKLAQIPDHSRWCIEAGHDNVDGLQGRQIGRSYMPPLVRVCHDDHLWHPVDDCAQELCRRQAFSGQAIGNVNPAYAYDRSIAPPWRSTWPPVKITGRLEAWAR
jgi:hypothetical protein